MGGYGGGPDPAQRPHLPERRLRRRRRDQAGRVRTRPPVRVDRQHGERPPAVDRPAQRRHARPGLGAVGRRACGRLRARTLAGRPAVAERVRRGHDVQPRGRTRPGPARLQRRRHDPVRLRLVRRGRAVAEAVHGRPGAGIPDRGRCLSRRRDRRRGLEHDDPARPRRSTDRRRPRPGWPRGPRHDLVRPARGYADRARRPGPGDRHPDLAPVGGRRRHREPGGHGRRERTAHGVGRRDPSAGDRRDAGHRVHDRRRLVSGRVPRRDRRLRVDRARHRPGREAGL